MGCSSCNTLQKNLLMKMGKVNNRTKYCRKCKRSTCKCSKKKVKNSSKYCKIKCKKCKKKCKRRSRFGRYYYQGRVVQRDSKGRFIRKAAGRRSGRILYKKHYLPKGARTTTKRIQTRKKPVKNKRGRVIGRRLSARSVYNKHGRRALGKSYSILQRDGRHKRKVLKLRRNGSPYFANKFGG